MMPKPGRHSELSEESHNSLCIIALRRKGVFMPFALAGLLLFVGCSGNPKNSEIDTTAGHAKTWPFVRRGEKYLDQKEYQKAEKEFREVVRLSPDWDVGYGYLATVLENQGKYRESEKALKHLVKERPDQATIHWIYGRFLFRRGRFKEAEVEFRNVLILNPDPFTSDIYKELARCLDVEGKSVEAQHYWDKAIYLDEHPKKLPFIPCAP